MTIKDHARFEASHVLKDAKLFMPNPCLLNDPFECKPHLYIGTSDAERDELKAYIEELGRKYGYSNEDAENMACASMGWEDLEDKLSTQFAASYQDIRICSLTTSWEHPLFWAHYASSHTGFCLEFDSNYEPFATAYKVEYTDQYPTLRLPRDDKLDSLCPVLMKAEQWAYEEEYRVILVPNAEKQAKNDGESLLLSGAELKAVYLGVNISQPHKEFLLKELKSGPFNPTVYQCELSRTNFKINRRLLGE